MLEKEIGRTLYGELWKWGGEEIPTWRKGEIIKFYSYEEEYFIQMLAANDVVVSKESEEKTIDMFQSFVDVPGIERIVEKTTYFDAKIDKKMEKIAQLSRIYMQEIEDKMYL